MSAESTFPPGSKFSIIWLVEDLEEGLPAQSYLLCWGSIPGPCACWEITLPPIHNPAPLNIFLILESFFESLLAWPQKSR